VLFAVMYLLLRRLVRLLANSSKDLKGDVEVVVLRHQLMIQAPRGRPRLRRRDLLFMAPMSRTLPRVRWSSFVVSPQTILRWHRESVKGKWTYKRISAGGRPPFQRGRPAACLESRELRRTPSSRWRGCSKTWASHPGRRRRALVSDACMLLRGVPAHWSLPSAGIRRARRAIGSDRSPRSGSPDAFQDQQGEPSGRDRDGVERKAAISRNPRSG
jgi:hypothetical protein